VTLPGKPRVLLADDHRMFAEALKGLLTDEFELVGIVEDGRAMVKAAQALKPDIIVADVSMPELNGIDALGDDQVEITFTAVSFADWLKWAVAMQLQRVRFEKGRIEALPEPGIVTVTGTFVRATTE